MSDVAFRTAPSIGGPSCFRIAPSLQTVVAKPKSSKMNSSTTDVEYSIFDLPPEGSFYYKIEGFLAMFYLVHPKRTMYPTIDTPNFMIMVSI